MSSEQLTAQSACDLADQVRSGALGAAEVTGAHLRRIEAVTPGVNAIVDFRPEQAMQQAMQIDALPDEQRAALPLIGLPTAVQDLEPAAGFRWTQGGPISPTGRPPTLGPSLAGSGCSQSGPRTLASSSRWPRQCSPCCAGSRAAQRDRY